jgi:hypothetical protein
MIRLHLPMALILGLALTLACGETPARCISFLPKPGESELAKAEIKHAVATSDAIFIGQVSAMEYTSTRTDQEKGEMLIIKMTTRSWWKGARSEEVQLDTETYRSSAGMIASEAHEYPYKLGKVYLVYARTVGESLRANICTRTKLLEEAAEDIALLDILKGE